MTKRSTRFLALLRGINVGGKNVFRKEDLRQCFLDIGFDNVRTFIQSGNILFQADENSIRRLTLCVELGLAKRFSYDAKAVVFSHSKYRAAMETAPKGWGTDETQKHNVLFNLAGLTSKTLFSLLPTPKHEIETLTLGPGVLFWSASKKHLTKTTLMKLPKNRVYKRLTIRNHRTALRLLELLEEN